MTGTQHLSARPPLWRVLVLLGLLVGVLGMHGLAPSGGVHGHDSPRMTAVAVGVDQLCHDGCGSGHLHHADVTCASASVSGGPTLPSPVPDPAAVAVLPDDLCAQTSASQDGARAPPSLAELQLLRI